MYFVPVSSSIYVLTSAHSGRDKMKILRWTSSNPVPRVRPPADLRFRINGCSMMWSCDTPPQV